MTANPPTITCPPGKEYTEADLAKLARQFPDFNWHEYGEDYAWFAAETLKGSMNPFLGKVVAIYQKQVIGVGDDYIAMRLELSRRYNINPCRIVTVYHGE